MSIMADTDNLVSNACNLHFVNQVLSAVKGFELPKSIWDVHSLFFADTLTKTDVKLKINFKCLKSFEKSKAVRYYNFYFHCLC